MKKLVVFFLIIGGLILAVFISNKKDKFLINNNALISYYAESESGTGVYEKQDGTTWPDGYVLNEEKSTCDNGSILSWDSSTNSVVVTASKGDKCKIYLDKNDYYLNKKILEDNSNLSSRTNFDSIFVQNANETLYSVEGNRTEDINGDGKGEIVYYFAGNTRNNWVKFGKNEKDEDLYWRIIRINEDKSVRLLYVGTSVNSTTAYVGTSVFSNLINDHKYVGYMYGTTGEMSDNRTNENDSEIKKINDAWYENTLLIKKDDKSFTYDSYISKTAIYCNDRSSDRSEFSSYMRLNNYGGGIQPSYRCGVKKDGTLSSDADIQDKFTVSDTSGNGDLKYPIGLMTADEIAFAGGLYENSLSSPYAYYYLNANDESVTGTLAWWTITPRFLYGNSAVSNFIISGSGNPGYLGYVYNNRGPYGVRPVVSLKSCVTWKNGNGSSSLPYEVFIGNSCAISDN